MYNHAEKLPQGFESGISSRQTETNLNDPAPDQAKNVTVIKPYNRNTQSKP